MMSSPVTNVSPPEPRSTAQRTLTIAGVLLFLLGVALAVLLGPQVWYTVLRWAGLALIGAAGLRGASLTYWIFFSMLLGGEIGLDRPQLAEHLRVLSDIFLRLIKVIVAPLILGTLVTGIAGHGNLRSVGRIGLKSLVYFEVVTTLALFIGVGAINISRAGEGLKMSAEPTVAAAQNAEPMRWQDFLLHIFPENIAKSIAENQILQVAVFALLFGIALALLPQAKREPMLKFCESLSATMFSFTNLVMYFAPVGVGAAMAPANQKLLSGSNGAAVRGGLRGQSPLNFLTQRRWWFRLRELFQRCGRIYRGGHGGSRAWRGGRRHGA